jgi:hypothetical protein
MLACCLSFFPVDRATKKMEYQSEDIGSSAMDAAPDGRITEHLCSPTLVMNDPVDLFSNCRICRWFDRTLAMDLKLASYLRREHKLIQGSKTQFTLVTSFPKMISCMFNQIYTLPMYIFIH